MVAENEKQYYSVKLNRNFYIMERGLKNLSQCPRGFWYSYKCDSEQSVNEWKPNKSLLHYKDLDSNTFIPLRTEIVPAYDIEVLDKKVAQQYIELFIRE